MSASEVSSFPFSSLESLTRADVVIAARLRRVAKKLVALEGVEAAFSELVDARVSILVRKYRRIEAGRGADDAVGVMLAAAGERATSQRVLVEVEGALAAAMTARALRQRAPRVTDPARSPSAALSGAFAAVLSTALRRAHAGTPLRVVAAGPASALARDLAHAERDVTTVWLTVVVGDDAFEARVSVPDSAGAAFAERSALSREGLIAMGDVVLGLPLVAATVQASRFEVDALATGDALVFSKVGAATANDGVLVGPVALVPARAEHGVSADLAEDGRLVVRGLLESHPWERSMPSIPTSDSATIEVLEHAPVVVRVELGTVEMKAREWADLGPGDVIALGRKIGDPAILRVAGVELARGELVVLDGEYAVRILSRTAAERGVQG